MKVSLEVFILVGLFFSYSSVRYFQLKTQAVPINTSLNHVAKMAEVSNISPRVFVDDTVS
jgi:hypothetical protein